MSSSGQGGSGGREDKPRGLAKFMRRASLVLKRDKSKRQSISNPSALAAVSDSTVPTQSSSTQATRYVNSTLGLSLRFRTSSNLFVALLSQLQQSRRRKPIPRRLYQCLLASPKSSRKIGPFPIPANQEAP